MQIGGFVFRIVQAHREKTVAEVASWGLGLYAAQADLRPSGTRIQVRRETMSSSSPALRSEGGPLPIDSDSRRRWIENFRVVRSETERRAAPLSPEDQIVQSMADA